ncbi:hypothetical protein QBC33DRAFT_580571 [Phialemonium atrogriseum]|uniref:Translation elongation factor IF5A C-terminal domain-containing protein n=1 Tax=Phialemonium atrogriseum TaxID=1093897 RepID=A0AAJ0FE87_9PEZI|nr:uncharacterized protein QBC33DRAFT_580571 [Phialemonium atrogriseum]KAK1764067.1 hypothetical protein QBC33DRAFT_580571 [Phialemonium atrogriseum]
MKLQTLITPYVANLDFEARVPVPFSIFPSSYREAETETTQTHEELEIKLPNQAGREGQYSSYQAQADLPPNGGRYSEEEVHITREEDHYRRPGVRRPHTTYTETHIDIERPRQDYRSPIDVAESEYRARFQPNYREEVRVTGTTVDAPSYHSGHKQSSRVGETTVDAPHYYPRYQQSSRVDETTVDPPHHRPVHRSNATTLVDETTVDAPRYSKSRMGYHDDDGQYHSLRHGVHKLADRILHPEGRDHHVDVTEIRESRSSSRSRGADNLGPSTVTIPCHHIRLGDILILQGRPCQVIRISTSAATGQHRYLGVDLFTKQLHEESSSISHPAPSVVVQTMLGPILKQYRVLDIQDGSIVAMTETGDVKQNLPVLEQSNLWNRLQSSFESGRGSIRVLVVSDRGRELAVDLKVVHGSRL